jgi:hypothetical protein
VALHSTNNNVEVKTGPRRSNTTYRATIVVKNNPMPKKTMHTDTRHFHPLNPIKPKPGYGDTKCMNTTNHSGPNKTLQLKPTRMKKRFMVANAQNTNNTMNSKHFCRANIDPFQRKITNLHSFHT